MWCRGESTFLGEHKAGVDTSGLFYGGSSIWNDKFLDRFEYVDFDSGLLGLLEYY